MSSSSAAPNELTNEQLLKQALSKLLQSNFDADTKTCLTTLIKVLDNVLQQPLNPKVRSIRMANPAFSQKVVQRPGGVDYLLACGFEQQTPPPTLLSKDTAGEEAHLVLSPEREDTSHLVLARRLLTQTATLELHMKAEDLPRYKPPPPKPTVSSSSTTAPSSSLFDVYKGHRFDAKSAAAGQQLGPDGTYVSKTETQLDKLQKQQEKLERKLQKPLMDRGLVVTLPSSNSSSGPIVSLASTGDHAPSTSDGSLLAQHMQKREQERLEREKQGFTTKAMRDLKHMKQAKVYSHVQLRIQFSDGSVLTGKFLPKETVETVKRVILQNCVGENLGLDLYVAPPRRKLNVHNTLQEEGLVPAARVIASWLVGQAPPSHAPAGSFWNPDLVSGGDQPEEYPTAKPLVDERKAAAAGATNGATSTATSREDELMRRMMGGNKGLGSGAKGDASTKKKNSGEKPKWFKK